MSFLFALDWENFESLAVILKMPAVNTNAVKYPFW